MKKIRIGFVGVGFMGQCANLSNYVGIQDCEVIAIAEIKKNLAEKVAQKYHVKKVYHDFRQMLVKEKPDGIVASQPFDRHGTILPGLVEQNIPIFIEKP